MKDWIDLRWAQMPVAQRERVEANIEDLAERQALASDKPLTMAEVEDRERRARAIVEQPHHFDWRYWSARRILDFDIPQLKARLCADSERTNGIWSRLP